MIRKLIAACAVTAVMSLPAQAQSNEAVCGGYAAFGKVIASKMLDLTLRDVVGMMQGTRPDIMAQITAAIEHGLTPTELNALTSLSSGDQSLLGEAAGGHAINLLMSGQAGTPNKVNQMMLNDCKALGYSTVIANQRKMNELMRGR